MGGVGEGEGRALPCPRNTPGPNRTTSMKLSDSDSFIFRSDLNWGIFFAFLYNADNTSTMSHSFKRAPLPATNFPMHFGKARHRPSTSSSALTSAQHLRRRAPNAWGVSSQHRFGKDIVSRCRSQDTAV